MTIMIKQRGNTALLTQHLQTTLAAAFVGNRTGSRGHDGPRNTSVGGKGMKEGNWK